MTTADRPTVEAVKQFWEQHVNNEYYTSEARGTREYFDEIAIRRYRWHYHLRDLFAQLSGQSGKLLEIGCGIGVDSVELAKCGFDVTAVDLTETAIDVARTHARLRGVDIDFRVGNAERLAFPEDTFDVVYSFGVLHHTPDTAAAVEDVRRVLKPGGRAFVMLYHKRSLVNLVHRLFNLPYESPRSLKDHCPVVRTYTRAEVRELFADFDQCELTVAYPFTYGMRFLTFWIPRPLERWLGRRIGWHLMIRAIK
jgi:ubiquinone/menaquinone biosynthesis C-methylase UbiE